MTHRTLAMSVIFFGEAVRFNRGKVRGDDYDFKYMRGANNAIYPYVSGQSFKKHWRDALAADTPPSPITRPVGKGGQAKNQSYTAGNPVQYLDDDLFGYMIAGAEAESAEAEKTTTSTEGDGEDTTALLLESGDDAVAQYGFQPTDFKNEGRDLWKIIKTDGGIGRYFLERIEEDNTLAALGADSTLDESQQIALAELLNDRLPDSALASSLIASIKNAATGSAKLKFPTLKKPSNETFASGTVSAIVKLNRELLGTALSSVLLKAKIDPTKRRTAPVRLHALVAFCGIKLAKDFQTMSRDTALTGLNSVLNPSTVGIYSAWLKTRILIEGHRIGKFYYNENGNLDLLKKDVEGKDTFETGEEIDPFSPRGNKVSYALLNTEERTSRLQKAIRALANINNVHGPASGALHDGSLRPQGFVAAMMNCADSPFDFVWAAGTDGTPYLDTHLLKQVLRDYSDLLADRRIYIGLPLNSDDKTSENIETALESLKQGDEPFEFIIDTPRQTLLKMANEVYL